MRNLDECIIMIQWLYLYKEKRIKYQLVEKFEKLNYLKLTNSSYPLNFILFYFIFYFLSFSIQSGRGGKGILST
jgi:hypothetical protein